MARRPPRALGSEYPRIEADLSPIVPETARARLLAADLPARVLGHGDLSGLNVRWRGQEPVIHDWDSVVALP
jgi:hypothetical protein